MIGKYNSSKKCENATIRAMARVERNFPTIEDEKMQDLACAIIEQAVWDWKELEYGRLGYVTVSNYHALVFRSDVESFFRGDWFEFLLSYALPDLNPAEFRKIMRIGEVAE